MNKKTRETIFILLRAAVAFSLFVLAAINYDRLTNIDINALVGEIDDFWTATGIILGVYIIKSLVFVVPASIIYVAVGALFGGFTACAVNMTGIFLEITITFILGWFLSGETVNKIISKKESGRKLLEMNLQDKAGLMFTIRLLPVFPIDFVSLFYGASKSGYFKYVLLSLAGLAPRVIAFTLLGSAAFDWIPLDKIILAVICAIPVGVVIYLIKKLVIERKKAVKSDGERNA